MTTDASKPARKRAKRAAVRRKPKRATDAEFVAQVVADADTALGIDGAAAKHGISSRTVVRYRSQYAAGDDADLSSRVAAKRAAVAEARAASTLELLDFLEAKMREAATIAAALGKLYEVAGAFKIVHDSVRAGRLTDLEIASFDDDDEKPAAPAAEAPHPSGLRVVTGGR